MILQNNAQRTPRYDHPICWRLGDLAALDPKADVDFRGSFSADPRLSDALLSVVAYRIPEMVLPGHVELSIAPSGVS
jgi:hypothetical protein